MTPRMNARTLTKSPTTVSSIALFLLSATITGCDDASEEASDVLEETGEVADEAGDATGG